MDRPGRLLGWLTVGIAAATAVWVVGSPADRPQRDAGDAEGSGRAAAENAGALRAELSRLRARVAALEGATAATGSANGDVEEATREAAPAPTPTPSYADQVSAALEQEKRDVKRLETTLAAEPRDSAWARDYEQEIAAAMDAEVFAGSRLQETSCGSTLCRSLVEHDSMQAMETFEAQIANHSPDNQGGFYQRREAGDGRFEHVFFLARRGSHAMRTPDPVADPGGPRNP